MFATHGGLKILWEQETFSSVGNGYLLELHPQTCMPWTELGRTLTAIPDPSTSLHVSGLPSVSSFSFFGLLWRHFILLIRGLQLLLFFKWHSGNAYSVISRDMQWPIVQSVEKSGVNSKWGNTKLSSTWQTLASCTSPWEDMLSCIYKLSLLPKSTKHLDKVFNPHNIVVRKQRYFSLVVKGKEMCFIFTMSQRAGWSLEKMAPAPSPVPGHLSGVVSNHIHPESA